MSNWFVYMVRCADSSLYTGITTDIDRRLSEHNHLSAGARYTRTRRPVTLAYLETATDRAAACQREYQLRKLDRAAKLALVERQISIS